METYYEDCAGKTLRFKLIFSNSTQKKVSYLGENPISFEKKKTHSLLWFWLRKVELWLFSLQSLMKKTRKHHFRTRQSFSFLCTFVKMNKHIFVTCKLSHTISINLANLEWSFALNCKLIGYMMRGLLADHVRLKKLHHFITLRFSEVVKDHW